MGVKEKKQSDEALDEPSIPYGEFVFPNQDRYKGQYLLTEEGVVQRHGQGTHTTSQGIVYTGSWSNDKMDGNGRLMFPSGAIYEGEFAANRYNGQGLYTWSDGCHYKGSFENSKLNGEGVFCDSYKQLWTGSFHNKAAPGLKFKLNL